MSQKRRTASDEPHFLVRMGASDHRPGALLGEHRHDWHQLALVTQGLMTVSTEAGSWVAPPSIALWIPAGTRHGIRFIGASRLRTAWFPPDRPGRRPQQCSAVAVSPLLAELMQRACELGMLDERVPVERAIATLIDAEFERSDIPPFTLPQPRDRATSAAARFIADGAAAAESIDRLAEAVGLSGRSLERRFHEETGMSPGRWRRQYRMLAALERLAAGMPIKAVAAMAGYGGPSAFVAAFRNSFGTTPGRYFDSSDLIRSDDRAAAAPPR
jgi:AraC-like DNA-binding protein/quercetin dioxygenase-like cupin family protein